MLKLGFVIGTRPEAIKCALPIIEMRKDERFDPVLISTGQHNEMLHSTLSVFGITADADLKVMRERQTISGVTHRILDGLSKLPVMQEIDAIVVHGDTASTVAGALFGFQNKIPVIHIEAGLRSGNLYSPFPEEGNRRLVSQISSLHLAPTVGNYLNLLHEGISADSIAITGNTVIDALHWSIPKVNQFNNTVLDDIERDSSRIILASTHRRESWPKLTQIAEALADVASLPNVRVVVPLHKNPIIRDALLPLLQKHPNITLLEPLPYLGFVRLMLRADVILSDSSGAEEEGPALGKPTLILREITERPEAIFSNSAKLVGNDRMEIVNSVREVLSNKEVYDRFVAGGCPYGDGKSTHKILDAIDQFFNRGCLSGKEINRLKPSSLTSAPSLTKISPLISSIL
ncbi:putative UDP-N-acetylglucosamine 2-epimerase [Xenorhabdus bovienii str. kraussei Quebec]|uniref:UDP-N-acetylglucosamine 2-epimerase (non-hydrolyzing) n=1 Tax=Xenorhabdus bovienii str. kraussei Quebec TaxID=1398203 RepID=A0A077PBC9_XENBV|nr:UDP-N-acetylglucosamine 2-epimerase (non-hydrolyzing) [Xenorhabdus bovienii]CDH21780.1 putative UDP-N-acetylglucosamine 2-epimerase [Xenorhabdus bovienii str. kraussei Quebec]